MWDVEWLCILNRKNKKGSKSQMSIDDEISTNITYGKLYILNSKYEPNGETPRPAAAIPRTIFTPGAQDGAQTGTTACFLLSYWAPSVGPM